MLSFLKKFWAPITLLATGIILSIANFTPGTILSGWDTLHPEFNWAVNFERVIFGVFRPEQGLGAVAAHSHMSDLPRMAMLYFTDLILPTELIRYFYIFATLIFGPLGLYFFLKYILKKEFPKKNIAIPSFLGALAYMLNLGTLQQFVVPFEMFNALFAFLPWIFLFTLKFIYNEQKHKSLLIFALLTFLASPMAYAPALWYIHFFLLFLFSFIILLPGILKKKKDALIKLSVITVITLLVNAYWFLPHLYFLFTHSKEVQSAYVNKLFSDQAFLYNKEYGNLKDLSLLKSFLFSWSAHSAQGGFTLLLQPWILHLNNVFVSFIGYFLAGIAIFGLVFSAIKKRIIFVSLIVMLLFSLIFLINDNFPTGWIYSFIKENIPLFKEAFRFPHTKLYIHYIFLFSVFFGIGALFGIEIIEKVLKKWAKFAVLFILSSLIFFFTLPAFQGEYISPLMRVKIPNEYYSLFNWLERQENNGRIATLPVHSFWNWEYYNWGKDLPSFQGAGFTWFGIGNPMLHRSFDRWSSFNEQYYKEMSYAVYSSDIKLFENVIRKYNINYLIFDKTIASPEQDPRVLYHNEIKHLLGQQTLLTNKVSFGEIDVYSLPGNKPNEVYLLKNYKNITPEAKVLDRDTAFDFFGDYITNLNADSINFPFRNLTDNQGRLNKNLYGITDEGIVLWADSLSINNQVSELEKFAVASVLVTNQGSSTQLSISPKNIFENTPSSVNVNLPQIDQGSIININNKYSFEVPQLSQNASYLLGSAILSTAGENKINVYDREDASPIPFSLTPEKILLSPCGFSESTEPYGVNIENANSMTLFGRNAAICATLPFSNIFTGRANLPQDFILGISYDAKSNSINAPTSICIAKIQNGNCISYLSNNLAGIQSDNVFYFAVNRNELDTLGLNIFLDATKSSTQARVEIRNLRISFIAPTQTSIIGGDLIKSVLPRSNISSDTLTISFSGETNLSQDITRLPKSTGRCETNPRVAEEESENRNINIEQGYIRYRAKSGSLCDTFSYQNLSQDQGYVALITSRNRQGLPLNICIANFFSKRCDVYTRLSDSKEFTTEAFILPSMSSSGSGYDVNVHNLAIKGTPSENDLKSIVLVPIHYDLVQNLTSTAFEKGLSSRESLDYKITNPTVYEAEIIEPGVVVLGYAYDRGWAAYELNGSNFLSQSFPFFFGKRLPKHVLVNNWANGWEVDNVKCQMSTPIKSGSNVKLASPIGGCQIIIVFLPQYFQYIGLLFTFGTLIVLSVLIIKVKRPKHHKHTP